MAKKSFTRSRYVGELKRWFNFGNVCLHLSTSNLDLVISQCLCSMCAPTCMKLNNNNATNAKLHTMACRFFVAENDNDAVIYVHLCGDVHQRRTKYKCSVFIVRNMASFVVTTTSRMSTSSTLSGVFTEWNDFSACLQLDILHDNSLTTPCSGLVEYLFRSK